MCQHDGLDDVQAETDAVAVGRAALVRLMEAVEDERQFLRRNGRAGIADRGDGLIPAALHADGERAAVIDELHGIVDKVIEHLRYGVRHGPHSHAELRHIYIDIQVLAVDALLKAQKRLPRRLADVEVRQLIGRDALILQAGNLQHVAHEP